MPETTRYEAVADISDRLLEVYLAQPEVAIDVEMQGLRLQRDRVCLVQICDRKKNVCLVRPKGGQAPPNLKRLLTAPDTRKVFHFALTDISFIRTSLGVDVASYRCTKIMSKLARTYSDSHSLKTLVAELLGLELDKENQQTNWAAPELTHEQLKYAANDVLHLLEVYDILERMLKARGSLPSGITAWDLNEQSQACLPTMVELVLNGYGDRDQGWETSLYAH